MSEKKMVSIIILAQAAHHTPTLMSSNGNSYMILELSAESDTYDIM
jgi:hypothetical protein